MGKYIEAGTVAGLCQVKEAARDVTMCDYSTVRVELSYKRYLSCFSSRHMNTLI